MDGVHDLVAEHGRLRFDLDDGAMHEVLPELTRMEVTGLTITPPSLEDLFLRHYGDDLSDGAARREAAQQETAQQETAS